MSAERRTIAFTLNGRPVSVEIGLQESLVEVLQRRFDLFGARESCGQGLCGCCTILVDRTAVSGCLYLAAFADGAAIDTIEGRTGDALDAVQEAFLETSAFQCGFCTPGFILMARQLLDENPAPNDAEIRDYLTGNLCRCATYPEIIDAIKLAARKRKELSPR